MKLFVVAWGGISQSMARSADAPWGVDKDEHRGETDSGREGQGHRGRAGHSYAGRPPD